MYLKKLYLSILVKQRISSLKLYKLLKCIAIINNNDKKIYYYANEF